MSSSFVWHTGWKQQRVQSGEQWQEEEEGEKRKFMALLKPNKKLLPGVSDSHWLSLLHSNDFKDFLVNFTPYFAN